LTVDYGARFATYSYWNPRVEARPSRSIATICRARRLYVPRLVNIRRVAADPVTGEIRPAVFIGAFVPGSGETAKGRGGCS
jgi:hypothetical protein